jgi:hypothetical protein
MTAEPIAERFVYTGTLMFQCRSVVGALSTSQVHQSTWTRELDCGNGASHVHFVEEGAISNAFVRCLVGADAQLRADGLPGRRRRTDRLLRTGSAIDWWWRPGSCMGEELRVTKVSE